jgi:NitT/TauT family transport system permease protein
LEIVEKIIAIPDRLLIHSLVTLREVFMGFAMAVVVGVILAILIAHSRFLAESLYPLLVISQEVPQVAIAPILVIWFGHGDLPKVLVAFLISFFPMVVNTAAGLLQVNEDLIYLIRGLKASRLQILTMIRLPNALPYIFTGMRISITLSVIGAVVGEFVGGSEGLGYLVFTGTGTLDTKLTFAAITILAILGIVLFWIVGVVERIALPWATVSEPWEV